MRAFLRAAAVVVVVLIVTPRSRAPRCFPYDHRTCVTGPPSERTAARPQRYTTSFGYSVLDRCACCDCCCWCCCDRPAYYSAATKQTQWIHRFSTIGAASMYWFFISIHCVYVLMMGRRSPPRHFTHIRLARCVPQHQRSAVSVERAATRELVIKLKKKLSVLFFLCFHKKKKLDYSQQA